MRIAPDWYHELEAAGRGPDWVFAASWEPADALAAELARLAPRDFALYRASQAPCPIHGGLCDYALYIDPRQHDAVVAQLAGQGAQNIYIYHTVQACQGELQIVRGYGGYPGQHGAEETRCLRDLARAPGLRLGAWSVSYGGMGYPFELLRRGQGAEELLAYLS